MAKKAALLNRKLSKLKACRNTMNLENKFIYRLIAVLYYSSFTIFCVYTYFYTYNQVAYSPVDNNKSYINCNSGLHYSFSEADIQFDSYSNNSDLNNDDDNKAKELCSQNSLNNDVSVKTSSTTKSYKPTLADIEEIDNAEKYSLVIKRDWNVIRKYIINSIYNLVLAYFILNLVKETLIYLVFGKKISWDWLLVFYGSKK